MSTPNLTEVLDFTVKNTIEMPSAPHPDGGVVFVRVAQYSEIEALHELTLREIGQQVAPLEAMQDVYRHNPESLWTIFRAPTGDTTRAQLAGYYGFLHLNQSGSEALDQRTLRPRAPDMKFLAAAGERPAAVYVWAIVARRLTHLTIPLVGKGLGIKRYGGLKFYATAGTMGGLNGLRGYGFKGAADSDDKIGDLFQFYMPGEADVSPSSAA